MEIILEYKGWKLVKEDGHFIYILPDGRETHSGYAGGMIETMKERFKNSVDMGWVWMDYVYYVPYVYQSRIKIARKKAQHRSNLDIPKGRILSREEAVKAIQDVYPRAKDKLDKCRKALEDLHVDMDFDSGDAYEGDTQGIHDEHRYISFTMEGFDFSFQID